jgi:cytochrome c553
MRKVFSAAILFMASSVMSIGAHAADGNADDGRIKAYTCAGCHGIPGYRNAYPNYRVPKIYRQHYDYLVAALNAYRAGERVHPSMQAQGESMSDQDIADIARFLAGPAAAPAAP